MARNFPLTPRAQRSIQLAQIANFWGMIPIPLSDKIPTVPNWPAMPYESAVENFRRFASSRSAEFQERLNVGILTGNVNCPNPVVVVDIDKKNGGLERWDRWLKDMSPLPDTFTVRTGSGGLHVYFRFRQEIATIPKIVAPNFGIDFQTTGGQVVFRDRSARVDSPMPYSLGSIVIQSRKFDRY